jgi:pilus assembly protein Flp/PilA
VTVVLAKLKQLVVEENGQGMAEYGLILALIAVVVVVALGPLGQKIKDVFDGIAGSSGFEWQPQSGSGS